MPPSLCLDTHLRIGIGIYLQVDKEVWRVRDRKERWRLRTGEGQQGPLKYEDAVSSLRRALHACIDVDVDRLRAGNP